MLDYIQDTSIYQHKGGFLEIIATPGLGVEINEDVVRQATQTSINWKNSIGRNLDGTIAEW